MGKERIKPGYKQSELGQIPFEWEVVPFGDCFTFLKTYSFSREQLSDEKTVDLIQNIHYGDIHATFENEILDFNTEKRIPYVKEGLLNYQEINEKDFPLLKDGDLVIADASEDYVGVAESIELKNINHRKVVGGLHTFVARDIGKYTAQGFRTYALRHPHVVREVRRIATGFSVFGVSKTNIAKLKLPLPPLNEQTAIANLLSTWDKSINTLTQLIAQKELRKRWLMQQLLTGKKRLKGFKGKWKENSLDNLIKEYNQKPKSANEYVVLTSAKTGLMKQTDYYGDGRITNREDADYNIIPPGYLTYRSRSDDGLFTFNKNTLGFTGLISGYYPVFTIKNGDIDFVLMYCNYFRQKLTKFSIGTSQLVLSINALKEAKFLLPSADEQTAIANVLQSADAELNLLRQKLDKLKEQKKGLMQVLLTGKKRLKY